jgi:hypothetical protein
MVHVNLLKGSASTIAEAKLAGARSRATVRQQRCQLRSLGLAENRIGVQGARALAVALASCPSLRVLSVADNPLSDDGTAAIAAAIGLHAAAPITIQAIGEEYDSGVSAAAPRLAICRLEALNLSGCHVGLAGAQAMGKSLSTSQLRSLRLARNALSDNAVEVIGEAVASAPAITLLDLSGCRVTDHAALALTRSITRGGSSLRTLKLHDNALSDDAGRGILHQLTCEDSEEVSSYPPSSSTSSGAGWCAPEWVSEEPGARSGPLAASRRRVGLCSISLQSNRISKGLCNAIRSACLANRQAMMATMENTEGGVDTADAEVGAADPPTPREPALREVAPQQAQRARESGSARPHSARAPKNVAITPRLEKMGRGHGNGTATTPRRGSARMSTAR